MGQARDIVDKALKAKAGMLVRSKALEVFYQRMGSGVFSKFLIDEVPLPVAREWVRKNVSLIKTIDEEMHPEIAKRVIRVLRGTMSREELEEWLEEKCDVSDARAALIANDQIKKATEAFQIASWVKNGFTKVMWRHGGSKDYREYHKAKWDGHKGVRNGKPNGLNGYVFKIDRPPVIDQKTGERGFPGQCIGCSCYLCPMQ